MKFTLFTTTNSFEGKKDTETVIMVLRNHWFTLFLKLIGFVFAGIIPPLGILIFINTIIEINALGLFLFALAVYYMVLWYGAFYVITMYLLDVVVITDERIVDITQKGFFVHEVAELHLARVQDVSLLLTGIIETYFDYGDVEVQTAGTEHKFHFENMPHPHRVKETIMSLAQKAHSTATPHV